MSQPMFPVIHNFRGGDEAAPKQIPWELAERAYEKYAALFGRQQSLERMAERGGFHASELDEFIPGWRNPAPTTEG